MALDDHNVIDLISSDEDENDKKEPPFSWKDPKSDIDKDTFVKSRSHLETETQLLIPSKPNQEQMKPNNVGIANVTSAESQSRKNTGNQKIHPQLVKQKNSTNMPKSEQKSSKLKKLQTGLVLDQDTDNIHNEDAAINSFLAEQQQNHLNDMPIKLYQDSEFQPISSSIEGMHNADKKIKCRCSPPSVAKLRFSFKNNVCNAFYTCFNRKCNFYRTACRTKMMHWYRFGSHVNHSIVRNDYNANHLLQGRVGDCWFLSALAVIAARPDLIEKLLSKEHEENNFLDTYGMIQVQLFIDGFWRKIILDNYLPCLIEDETSDPSKIAYDNDLQLAIQKSLGSQNDHTNQDYHMKSSFPENKEYFALSEVNIKEISDTKELLYSMASKEHPRKSTHMKLTPKKLCRGITSEDLAYSKCRHNQLWVPFIEKAYAKFHGSYQAISGGQIAEAFLDLTGAPTLEYYFDKPSFNPKTFWKTLLHYRQQRLPLGCGTGGQGGFGQLNEVGLVGGHAYSILDVVEIRNVGVEFFEGNQRTMGNVSGFTKIDCIVRLLRIRNPHGVGEWKGDFSDKSEIWKKLIMYQSVKDGEKSSQRLERTHKNDGTFWIDYDHFLMSFTNVDVVLAFEGNHAKSFSSNFPAKNSSHRCTRAFEVTMLDKHSCPLDEVEVYVMGIQKTRRGATRGRLDRKKSYKHCDLGFLVGKIKENDDGNIGNHEFDKIEGKMLGFTRVGHHHIKLRRHMNKSVIVMPVSFGHPAATDEHLSFVVRFVSNAPIMVRELPKVPRLDLAFHQFCLQEKTLNSLPGQAKRQILYENDFFRVLKLDCTGCWVNDYMEPCGGTIFIYLHVDQKKLQLKNHTSTGADGFSFTIHITCRGMSVRTEDGLIQQEKIKSDTPRQKFKAAWRKYMVKFHNETKPRLLLTLFKSGVDSELGLIQCLPSLNGNRLLGNLKKKITDHIKGIKANGSEYETRGIFAAVDNIVKFHPDNNMNNLSGIFIQNLENSFSNDVQFEMALALSKEESELKQAIEKSKKDLILKQTIDDSSSETMPGDEKNAQSESQKLHGEQYLSTSTPKSSDTKSNKNKEKTMHSTLINLVDLCVDSDDSNTSDFQYRGSQGRSTTFSKSSSLEIIDSVIDQNGNNTDRSSSESHQIHLELENVAPLVPSQDLNDNPDNCDKSNTVVDLSLEQDDSNISMKKKSINELEDNSKASLSTEVSNTPMPETENCRLVNRRINPSPKRDKNVAVDKEEEVAVDEIQNTDTAVMEKEKPEEFSTDNGSTNFTITKQNQVRPSEYMELVDTSESEQNDEVSTLSLETQENYGLPSASQSVKKQTNSQMTESNEYLIEIEDSVPEKKEIEDVISECSPANEKKMTSSTLNNSSLNEASLNVQKTYNDTIDLSRGVSTDQENEGEYFHQSNSQMSENGENLIEIKDSGHEKRGIEDVASSTSPTNQKRLKSNNVLENSSSNEASKSNNSQKPNNDTIDLSDGESTDQEDEAEYFRKVKAILMEKKKEIESDKS